MVYVRGRACALSTTKARNATKQPSSERLRGPRTCNRRNDPITVEEIERIGIRKAPDRKEKPHDRARINGAGDRKDRSF